MTHVRGGMQEMALAESGKSKWIRDHGFYDRGVGTEGNFGGLLSKSIGIAESPWRSQQCLHSYVTTKQYF